MIRNTIKCTKCGSSDFELSFPMDSGIDMTCNGCGLITKIAVFDRRKNVHLINGEEMARVYDGIFTGDIDPENAYRAAAADAAGGIETDQAGDMCGADQARQGQKGSCNCVK